MNCLFFLKLYYNIDKNNFDILDGNGVMKQLKVYKFRVYPSDEQKIFFSCVCLVYNFMLNSNLRKITYKVVQLIIKIEV